MMYDNYNDYQDDDDDDQECQVQDVPQSAYVCPGVGLPALDRMGQISITQVPGRTSLWIFWEYVFLSFLVFCISIILQHSAKLAQKWVIQHKSLNQER